jgi:predicted short-subunit dehydrogenase-like oxidoreductase (DUF2520 family)
MIADASLDSPIAVVGAGRLGRALARALAARGADVTLLRGHEEARLPPARLLVLAVADDAIRSVATRIAGSLGDARPVALHLAGALDSSALSPLREAGCAAGSCHPLQTFPDADSPPEAFHGVTFGVEGDPRAVEAAEALVRRLGARSVVVAPGKKTLWHLAAVLAGNGAVALVAAAVDAMREAGLTERQALDAVAPLARRSLEGALARGPAAALSGPVARGDDATLDAHRGAIDAWDPARRALYEALVAEQRRLVAAKRRGDNS